MIIGKQAVLDYFELQQKPYFAIFAKGQVEKGNSVYRNDKDKDKDFDTLEAKTILERVLSGLQYGEFVLFIDTDKNVTNRGCNRVDFKIPYNEQQAQPTGIAGIGSVSIQDVETRAGEIAEKKFQELMLKKENEDLKAKNKELETSLKAAEKSASDPMNKFLSGIAPYSKDIISGLFPGNRSIATPAPISGVEPDATGEGDDNKLFTEFIEALAEKKPTEWRAIIQKLTNLIKNDPAKFEMAINFL